MSAPKHTAGLLDPTPAEAEAYARCVAFDRQCSLERGAGRSGLLAGEDAAAHAQAWRIVDAAFDRGVGFNREAVS